MKDMFKITSIAIMALLTATLQAQVVNTTWLPATGYWDEPGNWNNGLPTAADDAYVGNAAPARTAVITNGVAAVARWLNIAYGASNQRGAFVMSGGSCTVDRLHMSKSGCISSFTLEDGILTAENGRIGVSYIGTFTQTGGSVFGKFWILGHNASGQGTYEHSGGTATLGASAISLGYYAGATGVYRISGDSVLNATGGFIVSLGTGLIEQNGGTINSGSVTLGNSLGSQGMLELNDGTFNGADYCMIGNAGWGSVTQSAGSATFKNLSLGYATSGSGTYKLFDGNLSATSCNIGSEGIGVFEQYGGTNICGGWCAIGYNDDGFGSYLMSGGSFETTHIVLGGNVPDASNAAGAMTLSNGLITVLTEVSVGRYGRGNLMQSGGELVCTNDFNIGMRDGGSGVYTQIMGVARLNNVVISRDPGSIGRYVISGGTAEMTTLRVGYGNDRDGVFTIVGTNATVTVDDQMTVGASGTYEVTLTPDGLKAPSCGTLGLSTLSSLKVNASELLPYDLDNTEIPIVTFVTAPDNQFNTVTIETGEEYGELRSATVNYYPDRITLSVRVCRPVRGTLISIL